MKPRPLRRRTLLAAGLSLPLASAFAQAWPSKPIKIVVPSPPGDARRS